MQGQDVRAMTREELGFRCLTAKLKKGELMATADRPMELSEEVLEEIKAGQEAAIEGSAQLRQERRQVAGGS
jgi:hypothetical protein